VPRARTGKELLIDNLDRHRAAEPGIDSAKNLTHSAGGAFSHRMIQLFDLPHTIRGQEINPYTKLFR